MVVQHNMQAMNANRMLGITTGSQSKATEKLSSGYRINRAADDAAGLTISEKMRKQMRGLDRASTNAQDGVSCVQTAEGALTEVHSMLQRMNELAVQSANGTNATVDREAIQAEIDQLSTEIDRVSSTTKFNETYLLKGDAANGEKTVYFYKKKEYDSSAEILQGKHVYKTDGTEITDAEDLKTLLDADPDTKLLSAVGVEATGGGTDYTFNAGTKAKVEIDLQNLATGTSTLEIAGVDLSGKDGDAIVTALEADTDFADNYTVSFASNTLTIEKKVADATTGDALKTALSISGDIATSTSAAGKATGTNGVAPSVTADIDLYDADGNKISNEKAAELLAADGTTKLYKSPSKAAVEGTDYNYTPKEEKMAKLYDENGKAVAASDIGKMLEEGKKLYADEEHTVEVTEAELADYTDTEPVAEALKLNLHVGADSSDDNKISVEIETMSAAGIGVKGLDVSSEDTATAAIDVISSAIQQVSEQRSALGAIQNRLEHTIANLDNVVENTTAAESRIRDTDMAEMMVEYSKNNILAQAGQSMLAQANQSTQGVLSLLG